MDQTQTLLVEALREALGNFFEEKDTKQTVHNDNMLNFLRNCKLRSNQIIR
jgi:hypothetical protein